MTFFEDAVLTSTIFIRFAKRNGLLSPRNNTVTTSHNRQNMSSLDRIAEVELYTASGQPDVAASDAANKEIFSESNTVKLPGGGIDVVASHQKRLATKAAILSAKK
jgi:hypothetical protein